MDPEFLRFWNLLTLGNVLSRPETRFQSSFHVSENKPWTYVHRQKQGAHNRQSASEQRL
jgi:hypothetical protein